MNSFTARIGLVGYEPARQRRTPIRLLAIDPNSRGFGFVLFENTNLVDWGMAVVPAPNRNDGCVRRFRRLVKKYAPDRLILEDLTTKASRRSGRVRALHDALVAAASQERVAVSIMNWALIPRYWFDTRNPTKLEIACKVAELFPELRRLLPKKRRLWDSQDPKLSTFNAAALALAYIFIHLARTKENKA